LKRAPASSAFGNENSGGAQYRSRIVGSKTRCLPALGGSMTELSVTDGCRWRGGDGIRMRRRVPQWLVNIARYSKLYTQGNGPSSGETEAIILGCPGLMGDPVPPRNPAGIGSNFLDLQSVRFGSDSDPGSRLSQVRSAPRCQNQPSHARPKPGLAALRCFKAAKVELIL
jgi:hypothetical protein